MRVSKKNTSIRCEGGKSLSIGREGRRKKNGKRKGWLVFPSRWEREVCLVRFFLFLTTWEV